LGSLRRGGRADWRLGVAEEPPPSFATVTGLEAARRRASSPAGRESRIPAQASLPE
jgi:hypothetical protein